jgi:hypothetical protein
MTEAAVTKKFTGFPGMTSSENGRSRAGFWSASFDSNETLGLYDLSPIGELDY